MTKEHKDSRVDVEEKEIAEIINGMFGGGDTMLLVQYGVTVIYLAQAIAAHPKPSLVEISEEEILECIINFWALDPDTYKITEIETGLAKAITQKFGTKPPIDIEAVMERFDKKWDMKCWEKDSFWYSNPCEVTMKLDRNKIKSFIKSVLGGGE